MSAPRAHTFAAVDIALAVRRRLALVGPVAALVGPRVRDPAPDPFGDRAWLFVRQLQVQVEGSGAAAMVLSVAGSHARTNAHNTAAFPRLSVEVHADATREPGSNKIVVRDAEVRGRAIHAAVAGELHRVSGFAEIWGARNADPGVRVWASQSLGEPDVSPVPDWDGGARLTAFYALNVG